MEVSALGVGCVLFQCRPIDLVAVDVFIFASLNTGNFLSVMTGVSKGGYAPLAHLFLTVGKKSLVSNP